MTSSLAQRAHIAWWGWLATVATSLSFLPALADERFVVVGALFSGLMFFVGVGLRTLRTPTPAVVLLQLVVLTEGLLLSFTSGQAYGVVPTGSTWHSLQSVLRTGVDVAQRYPAPAPQDTGLLLMVVFAIAIVGVGVDFFGVGLGRVPLAGLPLLALYTIPVAALTTGVPFYWFVPGAAAFIAMVTADERYRLSHWGRLVSRDHETRDPGPLDTAGVSASGRRISVVAVSTAVILPLFIPAFSSSLLDGGRATGPGNGPGQTLSFDDPMVSLANSLKRDDPVDLLRIRSDATVPEYLRLVVLDTPGPNAWSTQPVNLDQTLVLDSVLPLPTGLSDGVASRPYDMTITPTNEFPSNSAWLPVPFNLRTSDVGRGFSYVLRDQTVAATGDTSLFAISSYDVSYATIDPTPGQLAEAGVAPAEIVDEFGAVPEDLPRTVVDTARSVTAGALNHYQEAALLQSFFRDNSEFSYNLDAGYGYGYDAMVKFLEQREGFCQQFAATMAMMARALGIPSRVVVGFLRPERTDSDGSQVMTSYNMHSWPELYFEGVGWVRFEPTPGVGAPLPSYAGTTTQPGPTGPSMPTAAQTEAAPTPREPTEARPGAADPAAGDSGTGSESSLPVPSMWVLVSIVALALLLLPAALRHAVRRARMSRPSLGAPAAEAAWMELRDHLRDLRLPWSGSMTPRVRAASITALLQGDRGGLVALGRLASDVERARYAASMPVDATSAVDAHTVMTVITKGADRGQRLRAFMLPVSLLPDIRAGWTGVKTGLRGRRSTV